MPAPSKLIAFFVVLGLALLMGSGLAWARLCPTGREGRRRALWLIANMWGTAAIVVPLAYLGGRAIDFDLPRYLAHGGAAEGGHAPVVFALGAMLFSGILLVRLFRMVNSVLGLDAVLPPHVSEEDKRGGEG